MRGLGKDVVRWLSVIIIIQKFIKARPADWLWKFENYLGHVFTNADEIKPGPVMWYSIVEGVKLFVIEVIDLALADVA